MKNNILEFLIVIINGIFLVSDIQTILSFVTVIITLIIAIIKLTKIITNKKHKKNGK